MGFQKFFLSLRSRRRHTSEPSQNAQNASRGLGDAESSKVSENEAQERTGSVWADGYGKFATRALQTLIILALTAVTIYALRVVSGVVIPIFIALILASAYYPFMKFLRNKGFNSVWATITTLLLSAITVTGIGWGITKTVQGQWDTLATKVEDGFWKLVEWGNDLPYSPSTEQWAKWQQDATQFITSSEFALGSIAGVKEVFHVLTGIILVLIILFFFLKDGPIIWRFLTRSFTGERQARARRIGSRSVETLGLYVRGTAIVAAVDAVGIYVGLLILGVPLALPLAVIVFFCAFIPFIGATLAGVLAALVALVTNGPGNMLAVIILVIAVNQLEGHLLQPVVMGRTLKLHPLVVLLALALGTMLSGILGAILAVPIVALFWSIVQEWNRKEPPVLEQ